MKKHISVLLIIAALISLISGCAAPGSGKSSGLSIVTTIFPEYDWVREILGDRASDAELTLLLDNGVDLHSYQPTVDDIMKISRCDMFIYVGGESDEWVEDALKEATNGNMIVINLLDALGSSVKEEEVKEGMQEEDEEDEEDGPEYDEHVWLSLRNAAVLCKYIADAVAGLDPENGDEYTANAAAYIEKLNALDGKYQSAVEAASVKTILFGDRFPFRYLADDYGLDYYAAFVGCSAETEASFDTVIFLAGKVDELGLGAVLTIETSDGSIARTVIDNTASKTARILVMDSLQSTTAADVQAGKTYLSTMESNLNVLKEALK